MAKQIFVITYKIKLKPDEPFCIGIKITVQAETRTEARQEYTSNLEQRKRNGKIYDYEITNVQPYIHHHDKIRR